MCLGGERGGRPRSSALAYEVVFSTLAASTFTSLLFSCQRVRREGDTSSSSFAASAAGRSRTFLARRHPVYSRHGDRHHRRRHEAMCAAKRPAGIEPAFRAWQARVLPLDDGRIFDCNFLKPLVGIEPTTFRLRGGCSEPLSYRGISRGPENRTLLQGFGDLADPRSPPMYALRSPRIRTA